MLITKRIFLLLFSCVFILLASCNGVTENKSENASGVKNSKFKEGADYLLFQRVRILDNTGFAQPQEAYSILLPNGWQQQSQIIWNAPGTECAGTFKQLKASSADNKYSLEMYPDVLYNWNTNQEAMQFGQQGNSPTSYCSNRQPIEAEEYFRQIFAPEELGNPQIVKVEPNEIVVQQMRQINESGKRELMQYGASQVQFNQSAINAEVKWNDGNEGLVILGVTIIETIVPNAYNGSYDKMYTTQVTKRIVFKYPQQDADQAKKQFSLIMGSFRSNPAWNDAVNNFWRNVRQRKHVDHIGRIRMLDEQTRQIGNQAIKNGAERLKNMDNDMRSWEASQSSQDKMHTNFIKTIREVENYTDESGKYELSSGYNHAWSRGDGSSFILSDDPNFNPSSIFQDQNWKEMRKTDQ